MTLELREEYVIEQNKKNELAEDVIEQTYRRLANRALFC